MQKFKKLAASLTVLGMLAMALIVTAAPAKAAWDMTYVDALAASGTGMMQDTGTAGFHIMGLTVPTVMGIFIIFGLVATVVGMVIAKLGGYNSLFGRKKRR